MTKEEYIPRAKEFRIYRPNPKGNGCASSWQLSYKPNNEYDPFMVFLTIAAQDGEDKNGNAKILWKEKSITVKLGENDIGEILAVLKGKKDTVGQKGSLFHQTNNGNKVVNLNYSSEYNNYYLSVSSQTKDKKDAAIKLSHNIANGEAEVLTTLLEAAIVKMYNW